jgi:methionyl-tRNA formyltransferase
VVKRLSDAGALALVGVVTQPDRPADRGALREPAVKTAARAYRVPILQPERLHGADLEKVLALRPELLVWAAYGNLIPPALLDAAGGRAVNVHASLLPRWRGAAPIAHAILAGDRETGVSLMVGTAELDAGPVIAQLAVPIDDLETRGALEARLAGLGAQLLETTLPRYVGGEVRGKPQDERRATYAPKLDPRGGALDFTRPAEELARLVRAFTPDPGAYTTFRGQRIGVSRATVAAGRGVGHGTFLVREGAPHVAAGAGWLRLDEVRPAGRRAMSGAEWARGLRGLGEAERMPS